MKRGLVVVILLLLSAVANAKDKPQADYQDAVLVGFQTVHSGSSCSTSGTVKGQEDSSGNVSGTTNASSNCVDDTVRHYTLKVGDHTYVLKPSLTKGKAAAGMATMGWSLLFTKNSVLSNLLPGTHVQVRTDESGFYVKVGKRESKYAIVGAE
jgi:hypothetical protein